MRFSASRIKLWMDCSQAAYYRYHEHHPTEQSGAASFGTVIHHVLELQAQGGWTEEALVKRFEELWYEPGLLGVEPDYYHQRTSWSEYRALGVEVIKSYCRQYRLEDREVIATEYPFLVRMGKHELTGFVDLLEVRKNYRGKKTLQIVDLKTASKQPTKAQLAMDVQFSVYCYASLQKEFWVGVEGNPDFPGLPDGEELYGRFLDMPRRAIWRHLRTQKDIDAGDRTDEDFERLHLVLNEIEKADVAGVHVPRVGEACGLCDYSSICRAKIPDSFDIDLEDDNGWL